MRSAGNPKTNHHEQTPSIQNRFARNVKNVVDISGNPFIETSSDLFAVDTNVFMAYEVIKSVREAEHLRKAQYKAFVDDHMINLTKSIYDTIPKNNLIIFKSEQEKRSSKAKAKISSMKSDLELFSRMYISCQAKEGEMDVFFEHENHAWPPSLAEYNSMRHGNKADLLKCLELFAPCPPSSLKILGWSSPCSHIGAKECSLYCKVIQGLCRQRFFCLISSSNFRLSSRYM